MPSSDNVQVKEVLLLDEDAVFKVRNLDGTDTTVSNTNLKALSHTAGTGAAGEVLALDSNGDLTLPGDLVVNGTFSVGTTLTTEAGTGITGGTGTVYKSNVTVEGGIIHTRIIIDITGLHSVDADGDIIGVDQTTNPCHLGALTVAQVGTIFSIAMTCLEAPATGEPDIDLYSEDEGTGVTDDAISGLTNGVKVIDSGTDWTVGLINTSIALPADGQYLYLTTGTATAPTAEDYTAGKFLIEIYGYTA